MRKPTAKEIKVAKSKLEMNLPEFKRLARENMIIYFDSLIYKVKCKDAVHNYHMSMTKKFIKYSNKEIKNLKKFKYKSIAYIRNMQSDYTKLLKQLKNWKLAYKLLKKKGKK